MDLGPDPALAVPAEPHARLVASRCDPGYGKTATMISEEAYQAARKLREVDLRARVLADSVVAQAMQERGPIDPENADREAHDLALAVAALLVRRFYEDDAELKALRIERDHYRDAAIKFMSVTPLPPLSVKLDDILSRQSPA